MLKRFLFSSLVLPFAFLGAATGQALACGDGPDVDDGDVGFVIIAVDEADDGVVDELAVVDGAPKSASERATEALNLAQLANGTRVTVLSVAWIPWEQHVAQATAQLAR